MGCTNALVGLVEHQYRRAQDLLGPEMECFVTGGGASVVASAVAFNVRVIPELTMIGMATIAKTKL